jgi:hypothetical protein
MSSVWTEPLQNTGIEAAQIKSMVPLRNQHSRVANDKVDISSDSYAFSVDGRHASSHCVTRTDHY